MKANVARVIGLVRGEAGLALVGQALNLLALLLPVVTKNAHLLTFYVLATAVAGVLVRVATLAFPGRYLSARPSTEEAVTAFSIVTLVATASLLALVAFALGRAGFGWAGPVLAAAPLLLFRGLYAMSVTVLVKEQRRALYYRARFVYGWLNVLATALAVFVFGTGWALVWASVVPIAVILAWVPRRCRNQLLPPLVNTVRQRLRGFCAYAVESRRGTVGVLFADLSDQIQGFAVPTMQEWSSAWAVTMQINGGLGTVAQQLVAPPLEMEFVAAREEGDTARSRSLVRRALARGVSLGVVCATAVVIMVLAFVELPADTADMLVGMTAIAVFPVVNLGYALLLRAPFIAEREGEFAVLSLVRATLGLGCLLLSSGVAALIAQVVLQAIVLAVIPRISVAKKANTRANRGQQDG